MRCGIDFGRFEATGRRMTLGASGLNLGISSPTPTVDHGINAGNEAAVVFTVWGVVRMREAGEVENVEPGGTTEASTSMYSQGSFVGPEVGQVT